MKDKYLDLARELKKTMEHKSDGDTNYNWCAWYIHQRIITETGGLENKWTSRRDHPNCIIVEIGQNTENEETCCHSNSNEKPSANDGMKNSQQIKIMMIMIIIIIQLKHYVYN